MINLIQASFSSFRRTVKYYLEAYEPKEYLEAVIQPVSNIFGKDSLLSKIITNSFVISMIILSYYLVGGLAYKGFVSLFEKIGYDTIYSIYIFLLYSLIAFVIGISAYFIHKATH